MIFNSSFWKGLLGGSDKPPSSPPAAGSVAPAFQGAAPSDPPFDPPIEKIFAFRHFGRWEDIEHELRGCRFAFFTANQMRLMPADSVDMFVNICSLMDMRRDQIDYFLGRIAEVTRRVFMSKQWYEWENATDRIHVVKDDFRIRQGFEPICDQPDDIYKELLLQIWRRLAPPV